MTAELQSKAKFVKRVAVWCIERQGRCFKDWDASKIFKYLGFHYLSGSLFVSQKDGQITGVAVAWKTNENEIRMREALKQPLFLWENVNDNGTSLYISHLFGNRESSMILWRKCLKRWPMVYKIFAHRKDKLCEFTRGKIERLCHV